MIEEKTEVTENEKEQLMLMVHGEILVELLKYPRFQAFIAANYEIKPNVDDEAKSVGFTVREFSQQEVTSLMSKVFKEAQNKIVTASVEDLNQLDKVLKK